MSQTLQSLSVFDFTPPSSPTKLLETMHWLRRTPTSAPPTPTHVPLPPSPTRSLDSSNDDSTSSSRTRPPSPPGANSPKPTKQLVHKPSTTSPLHPKPSSPHLTSSQLGSPHREAARYLFRPSPVRTATAIATAIATAPVPAPGPGPKDPELGDHFTRTQPSHEEVQEGLRKRKEASQVRVAAMRRWMRSTDTDTATDTDTRNANLDGRVSNDSSKSEKTHHRFDSASFAFAHGGGGEEVSSEGEEGSPLPFLLRGKTSEEEQTPPLTPACNDILYLSLSLLRLRNHSMRRFDCMGCGRAHGDGTYTDTTHTDGIQPPSSIVWLLHSCRHLVDDGCFSKLRGGDIPALGDGSAPVDAASVNACYGCAHLRQQLGKCSVRELEVRRGRLVSAMGEM